MQDRCGSLFFMCMYLSLMSLSSLPLWRDDRLVFMKERAAGAYGTAAYFMAVVLFDVLPLRVLPPLLFTLTSYSMIGLRAGGSHLLRNALVGGRSLHCILRAKTHTLVLPRELWF